MYLDNELEITSQKDIMITRLKYSEEIVIVRFAENGLKILIHYHVLYAEMPKRIRIFRNRMTSWILTSAGTVILLTEKDYMPIILKIFRVREYCFYHFAPEKFTGIYKTFFRNIIYKTFDLCAPMLIVMLI